MRLLCIALLIALPTAIFAQSNYHEGYVLKNNGDTLKGYINYREWSHSPRSIDFKIHKTDNQTISFNPTTIKAFSINGLENYIGYKGSISMDKTTFPNIPESLDTTKKLDTLFLRQLAIGAHLTLFQHLDEVKTRFFIAEANNEPVELIYHQYYDDSKQIVNSDGYKGQLLLYINKFMPGNDKLNGKIERLTYQPTELVSIVNEINNNKSIAVKTKSGSRLFIGVSVTNTRTQVTDIDVDPLVLLTHTTLSPKINLGIDFFGNPNVQQFIFRTELSFSYIKPRFLYLVRSNEETTTDDYSFDQYTAAITPQLLFNVYNKDNFKVYINAGLGLNFSAYANNKFALSSKNTNTGTVQVPKPFNLKSAWVNYPFQAGVSLNKKVELFLSYVPYASFTSYSLFAAANQSMSFGVKYFLGKP